jgi:UDP-N-acetylmuramoyl-tripeptide--D-alanyl-D-alanine ligase
VLAAVTVGLFYGVDPEMINKAIENYIPSNNRSQLTETGRNHLIVDAYNANPTSMAAAIDNFALMQVGPKMAILGDMRELGESSHDEHVAAVNKLMSCQFDQVWLVGSEFEAVDCDYRKFADVEAVKEAIKAEPINGYYILIKGSNGIRLFQLPELL